MWERWEHWKRYREGWAGTLQLDGTSDDHQLIDRIQPGERHRQLLLPSKLLQLVQVDRSEGAVLEQPYKVDADRDRHEHPERADRAL